MSSVLPRPLWVAFLVLLAVQLGWMTVEAAQSGFRGSAAETLAGVGVGAAVAVVLLVVLSIVRRLRTS